MFRTQLNHFESQNFIRRYMACSAFMPRRHVLSSNKKPRSQSVLLASKQRLNEDIELSAYFRNEGFREVCDAFESSDESLNIWNRNGKLRAEIIYFPLLHDNLKKTTVHIKNYMPTVNDIETERERILTENRRVFVPNHDDSSRTKSAMSTETKKF